MARRVKKGWGVGGGGGGGGGGGRRGLKISLRLVNHSQDDYLELLM